MVYKDIKVTEDSKRLFTIFEFKKDDSPNSPSCSDHFNQLHGKTNTTHHWGNLYIFVIFAM